jgi:DNA-directed RNA polymerase specialized sigma24 family protein
MAQGRLRSVRPLGQLSDDDLISGIAQHDEESLHELRHRHGAALSVLACAMVRQPAVARRVVDETFASLWADRSRLHACDASVRAQLAALVHHRCNAIEPERQRPASEPLANAAWRRRERTPERVAVALIAFGDHTCRQAAERVGTDALVVAERLRAFVLDPDHFDTFRISGENVVALREAVRPRRATRARPDR